MNGIVILIISAIVAATFIVAEILLARKKSWVLGLVPILAVVLLMGSICAYGVYERTDYFTQTSGYSGKSGVSAELIMKKNRNGEVLCYSPLIIKNPAGEMVALVPMSDAKDSNGFYLHAAKYFKNRYQLQGDNLALETVQEDYMYFGNLAVNPKGVLVLTAEMTVPLLIIYTATRIIRRKKEMLLELKKLDIKMM